MSADSASRKPVDDAEFPAAEIRQSRSMIEGVATSRLWWVTALSLVLAATLIVVTIRKGGVVIEIRFQQGYGIKQGDALRYRGIQLGEVTDVTLDETSDRVEVRVEIEPTSAWIARKGSVFWIERPQVRLSRVTGLETIVGAKYIGVIPGPEQAAAKTRFTGVETPPTLTEAEGIDISIRFRDAHGLQTGDVVRYRGMTIGEVTSLDLLDDLSEVQVGVRLVSSAQPVARLGTLFWIERANVSLTGVRGLETLVGGRYLAVLPGPESGQPHYRFEGLEIPPAAAWQRQGGLEIVLEADHRSGLQRGAPVSYRGLQIGHIVSVGLSSDSVFVEARAFIESAYRQLIRSNTKFWSSSGVDLRIGFTGIEFDADTLSTIAAGGAALATPETPGVVVGTGHRFTLHAEADDEWRTWRPRIAIGASALPEGLTLPEPLRAKLRWQIKTLGFTRSRERVGWVLLLSGQRLLGPSDLLTPPSDAVAGLATLEVAGQRLEVTATDAQSQSNDWRILALDEPLARAKQAWPAARIRRPEKREDAILIADSKQSSLAVGQARFIRHEDYWLVDPSLPLGTDWHGAVALSRQDGALIGIVVIGKAGPQVALIEKPTGAELPENR